MEKLRPRAIIFDLGSTLIEYETIPWEELGRICVAHARRFLLSEGIDLPEEEEFQQLFDETKNDFRRLAADQLIEWDIVQVARKLLDNLGVNQGNHLPDRFFDVYYEPVEERLFVYDDTIATLKLLSRAYPTIGLISNTIFPERSHRAELKRFGIEPFLKFAVFSSSFGLRKPHPDIFSHAAQLAKADPADCIYVGDRFYEDVEGPTGIGMTPILKRHHKRTYPDNMPDSLRTIRSLSELTQHLHI